MRYNVYESEYLMAESNNIVEIKLEDLNILIARVKI